MAQSKHTKKKRKRGGRKLEFTIYIVGVLLICTLAFGVIKGVRRLVGNTTVTPTVVETSSTVATSSQEESSVVAPPQSQVSSAQTSAISSVVSKAPSGASAPVNRVDYVTYTKTGTAELSEWYLILVNGTSTISSSWTPANMTYVGSDYRLDSRIVQPYKDMINAAANDGVSLWPVSCYRPYETQQWLYNNRVTRAKNENPSFTQKQAEDYAATHVARPGTSEHQTGLAIDFNSVETSFGSTAAGKWLKNNAENYGFVLRYEEHKQSITGVTWEPWHYRFVGVKHAKRMNELGMCLEEYVAYIQAGNQ